MTHELAPTSVLRQLLNNSEPEVIVAVGSVIEGTIAEHLGAPAVLLGGAGVNANVFGQPDAGISTQTEIVEAVGHLCESVSVPVVADCDSGFGSASNVKRTVSLVLKGGASGLILDDQVDPPRSCSAPGVEVLPTDDAVAKLEAAVQARDSLSSDGLILARSDARNAVGGTLDGLLERLKRYQATGADAMWIIGLEWDEVPQVRDEVVGPLYVSTRYMRPVPTLDQLRRAGVSMTSMHIWNMALLAQWDFFRSIKDGGYDGGRRYLSDLTSHPLADGAWPGWSNALGLDQLGGGVNA